MAIQREITVKLANSPGTLAACAQVLGAERINMLAMTVEPSGRLRMVVDNPLHAAEHAARTALQVEERDVLYTTMPNEPGSLGRALQAAGEAASTWTMPMPAASTACRWSASSSAWPTREGVVRDRNLKAEARARACVCSFPPWTRISSSSMPMGGFASTRRSGRSRRCRNGARSSMPRRMNWKT